MMIGFRECSADKAFQLDSNVAKAVSWTSIERSVTGNRDSIYKLKGYDDVFHSSRI